MRRLFFIVTLLILMVVAIITTFGIDRKKYPLAYTAGLLLLPSRLDPWHNQINTNHFINLQIYYPLFSKAKSGLELTSAFLDLKSTHALNSKLDQFQFCLLPGVSFSDGTRISIEDLLSALLEAHRTQEVLPALKSLEVKSDCIVSSLKISDSFYFDKLAGVSSTILKKSTLDQPAPVGLGPYKVSKMGPDEIELIAVSNSSVNHFKKIIFKLVKDSNHGKQLGLIDLNHIYNGSIVPIDTKDYYQIATPILKTYSIVVSVPDSKLRHAFARCIDRRKFAKITGISLEEVPGFLPRGIVGADVSFDSIMSPSASECHFTGPKQNVKFLNHLYAKQRAFEQFFRDNELKLPFHVSVENYSPADTARALYSGSTAIAVVGFDSSGSQAAQFGETAVYFESFFRKERLIRDAITEVETFVKAAIAGDTSAAKATSYKQAHQALLSSAYVVPLGQYRAEQYYPKWISNIVWVDQLSGFPQIDRMQVR